ncbi:MAG: AI-2E family transporter [Cumulibacter sp.]
MARDSSRPRRPVAANLRQRFNDLRSAEPSDHEFDPSHRGEPIPRAVTLMAGWAWRLAAVGIGIYLLLWLLDVLAIVVVPVVISLLIAALLTPMARALRRVGLPNAISTVLTFLAGLIFLFGLLALIVREMIVNYNTIYDTVADGLESIVSWLADGPLQIDASQLQATIDELLANLQRDPSDVLTTSLTVVSTTGSILSAILLSMFIIFFFLSDGNRIWTWLCRLFPNNAQWKVNRAGRRSWEVLVTYMNVTLIVALAVGVATWLACLIAGVPLALSAGLIAFLFAFIPTLGALISSILVIALALISTNITTAIIMAIVMIVIQTLQGNFLYPLLMNRQLKVHPLASLLLVVLGAVVGGIFGALIAVPLAAVINTAVIDLFRASRGLPQDPDPAELGPDTQDEDGEDPAFVDPTIAPAEDPQVTATAEHPSKPGPDEAENR